MRPPDRQNKWMPMKIRGREIIVSTSRNTSACGPKKITKAVELCLSHVPEQSGNETKLTACDPLCGSGVIPIVLCENFAHKIGRIFASDASHLSVDATRRNVQSFQGHGHGSMVKIFRHNILSPFQNHIPDQAVDLVLTDPPYGERCHWTGKFGQKCRSEDERERFFEALFHHLAPKMASNSIIGIIANQRMKLADCIHDFRRTDEHDIPGKDEHDARKLYIMKRKELST